MTAVYLVAVIIGTPFVVIFVLSGFEQGDAGGGSGIEARDIVSLRSVAFFGAFFGAAGLLLTGLGAPGVVGAIAAGTVGVSAAVLNAMVVGLVRGGDFAGEVTVEMIEGREAEVVAPITGASGGSVSLDLDGQRLYLGAASHRGRTFGVGDRVVVVRFEQGAAFVAALDELA